MVIIRNLRDNKEYKIDKEGKIIEILEEIGINPVMYVILKNKKVVTEEDFVKEDDVIELVPVVSGG